MRQAEHSPVRHNMLLAALPDIEWCRMRPNLQPVLLPLGATLHEPGIRLKYIYFPTTAIISLVYTLADGAPTEIAVVSNDGLAGIAVLMSDGTTSSRALVRGEGWAYRLKDDFLRQELERSGTFRSLLLRYAQVLMTQLAQTAVCSRHHSIDQQLCRWLLWGLDRGATEYLKTTHDLIAIGLGVRRESVSLAAGRLRDAGVIHYHRGRIAVVNRISLEDRCCECYRVVQRETDRLLPRSAECSKVQSSSLRSSRTDHAMPDLALTIAKKDVPHRVPMHATARLPVGVSIL
jgi:CRP-like cAMP-binding protein